MKKILIPLMIIALACFCATASAGFSPGAGISILVPHLMQNFISSEISALQFGQFIFLIPLVMRRILL